MSTPAALGSVIIRMINSHQRIGESEPAGSRVLAAVQERGGDSAEQEAHGEVGDVCTLIGEPDLGLDLYGGRLLLWRVSQELAQNSLGTRTRMEGSLIEW